MRQPGSDQVPEVRRIEVRLGGRLGTHVIAGGLDVGARQNAALDQFTQAHVFEVRDAGAAHRRHAALERGPHGRGIRDVHVGVDQPWQHVAAGQVETSRRHGHRGRRGADRLDAAVANDHDLPAPHLPCRHIDHRGVGQQQRRRGGGGRLGEGRPSDRAGQCGHRGQHGDHDSSRESSTWAADWRLGSCKGEPEGESIDAAPENVIITQASK